MRSWRAYAPLYASPLKIPVSISKVHFSKFDSIVCSHVRGIKIRHHPHIRALPLVRFRSGATLLVKSALAKLSDWLVRLTGCIRRTIGGLIREIVLRIIFHIFDLMF